MGLLGVYDRGTYYRGWVGSKDQVEEYAQFMRDKKNLVSYTSDEIEQFHEHVNKERGNINEYLIKLSIDGTLGVCIISNTNETSADRKKAREWHAELKLATGIDFPIFIYIWTHRSLQLYTKRQQLDDEMGLHPDIALQKTNAVRALEIQHVRPDKERVLSDEEILNFLKVNQNEVIKLIKSNQSFPAKISNILKNITAAIASSKKIELFLVLLESYGQATAKSDADPATVNAAIQGQKDLCNALSAGEPLSASGLYYLLINDREALWQTLAFQDSSKLQTLAFEPSAESINSVLKLLIMQKDGQQLDAFLSCFASNEGWLDQALYYAVVNENIVACEKLFVKGACFTYLNQEGQDALRYVRYKRLNDFMPPLARLMEKYEIPLSDSILQQQGNVFSNYLAAVKEREPITKILKRIDSLQSKYTYRFSSDVSFWQRIAVQFARKNILEPLKEGLADEKAKLSELAERAEQFLKEHWQKTQFPFHQYASGDTYREMIDLFSDIAEWVAKEKNRHLANDAKKVSSISILVPIPTLPEGVHDIKTLLKLYAFDAPNEQFIPITILNRLNLDEYNPSEAHTLCEVDELRFTLVKEHSILTQQMVSTYEKCTKLQMFKKASGSFNLLDNLNALSDNLVVSKDEGKSLKDVMKYIDTFEDYWALYTPPPQSAVAWIIGQISLIRKNWNGDENAAVIHAIAQLQLQLMKAVSFLRFKQNSLDEIKLKSVVDIDTQLNTLKTTFAEYKRQLSSPEKLSSTIPTRPFHLTESTFKYYSYSDLLQIKPIKSVDTFKTFISDVPPAFRAGFFAAMELKWLTIIRVGHYQGYNYERFVELLKRADALGQRKNFLNSLQKFWPDYIKKVEDFKSHITLLSASEAVDVFSALQLILPTLIHTIYDYNLIRSYLMPDQKTTLITDLKVNNLDLWRHIIHESFITPLINQVIKAEVSRIQIDFETHAIEQRAINQSAFINFSRDVDTNYFNTLKPELIKLYKILMEIILPGQLMNQFFADNPWINFYGDEKKITWVENKLVSAFLSHILTELIQQIKYEKTLSKEMSMVKLVYEQCKDGDSQFYASDFVKPKVDKKWLQQQSYRFPFHALTSYTSDPLLQYSSVQDIAPAANWKSHAYTRMDLLRFITKHYAIQGVARVRPLNYVEFDQILEKDKPETALINMNTEDSPLWVLVVKKDNVWQVYVASNADAALKSIFPGSYQIHEVNDEYHRRLSDISGETPTVAWHALLLGRILPWHFNAPLLPLSQYRSTVPCVLPANKCDNHLLNY